MILIRKNILVEFVVVVRFSCMLLELISVVDVIGRFRLCGVFIRLIMVVFSVSSNWLSFMLVICMLFDFISKFVRFCLIG